MIQEENYIYEGLSTLTVNGDVIDNFSALKTEYVTALPLIDNQLSIAAIPIDESVTIGPISTEHPSSKIYVASFQATLPDESIINYQVTVMDTRQEWRPNQHKGDINISQFRVSTDNEYIDMVFGCPEDYYFTSLLLEVRTPSKDGMASQWFDLSAALFKVTEDEDNTVAKKRFVVRLPISALGVSPDSIFIGTLKAHYLYILRNGFGIPAPYIDVKYAPKKVGTYYDGGYFVYNTETEELVRDASGNLIPCEVFGQCEGIDSEITDTMICSNVNNVYRCMMNELMATKSACASVSDDLIRKYLILYGHQASLAVRDMETAEQFFKLLSNCFNKCPGDKKPVTNSCGCHD